MKGDTMNDEHIEDDEFFEESQDESQIIDMLKKIQQQLSFLEKKVDSLVGQSQSRPPRDRNFSKPFSKPFRPGGQRPHFQKSSDRDHRSGDRDRRPEQGQRSDDRRPDQGRPYENPNPRRNRGFSPRKKEGYYGKRG